MDESLEPTDDLELDHQSDLNESEEDGDDDEAAPIIKPKKMTSEGSAPRLDAESALPSVSSKEAERRALQEAMERFLQQGGKIQQLPPGDQ
jgi:hypothetical protein